MSTRSTDVTELLALRPGVFSVLDKAGRTHLVAGLHTEGLGRLDAAAADVLRGLAAGPRLPAVHPGAEDLLERLRAGGWLSVTVAHRDVPLYTLVPERPPSHRPPDAVPAGELMLSKFAVLRRESDQLVLESPTAWCAVRVHDAGILPELAAPVSRGSIRTAGLPPNVAERLRHDLWRAGLITAPSGGPESELPLRHWSPHELWFHERSRVRRPSGQDGWGATWWGWGEFAPPAAAREPFGGTAIELAKPDPAVLRATDPPLTDALEARRSIRSYDDERPLTSDQLAEFLHRCCRNRRQWTDDGVEYLSRPYPGGGSLYELEVYPTVRRVSGLDPGLYHYDAQHHRLVLVRTYDRSVDSLIRATTWSAPLSGLPQVVLVLAARFGRMMWKYESMAYAVTLKNVGVVYQLMYTVATAMGLAPCGLGGAGVDTFSAASGLDPAMEGNVGEFLLGSRPPPERAARESS